MVVNGTLNGHERPHSEGAATKTRVMRVRTENYLVNGQPTSDLYDSRQFRPYEPFQSALESRHSLS